MKKHLLLLFTLLSGFSMLKAQTGKNHPSTAVLNQEILKLSAKIAAFTGTADDDGIGEWNGSLTDNILEYASKTPNFLQQNFPEWDKNGVTMINSADKKLRIVFWNAQTSGTLREYSTLIFWQGTKGLQGKILDDAENASFHFIERFKRNDGSVFYLARGMDHLSNRDKVDFIRGFQINGAELNLHFEAFRTPKKKLAKISVPINMGSVKTDKDFIHYSEDVKTLFIPVVNEESEVKTNYYLIYQFDGNNFVFKKTAYLK